MLYFPSLLLLLCWRVCRTPQDLSAVVPLHSVTCSAACKPVFCGHLSTSISVETHWMGTEGTACPQTSLQPQTEQQQTRDWCCPFSLKFLLGHHLFSSSSFFFNLFRIPVEAEIRRDFPQVFAWDVATHAQHSHEGIQHTKLTGELLYCCTGWRCPLHQHEG